MIFMSKRKPWNPARVTRTDWRFDAYSKERNKRRPLVSSANAPRHKKGLYTATEMERYHIWRSKGRAPRQARDNVMRDTRYTRRSRQYKPKPKPSVLKLLRW